MYDDGFGYNDGMQDIGYGMGMDMTDPFSQDTVPYERMLELGFENIVLDTRRNVLMATGKLSNKSFEMCGVWNYKLRQDILYADKIIKGLIPVDNKQDLKKHLQKMNFTRKISMADLATSISPHNELKGIVKGLPQKSLFGIYNTDDTPEGVDIDTLSPRYITIWSDKYYKINAKQSRKLFRVRDLLHNRIKYYDSIESIEKSIKENEAAYKIERVAELLNVQTVNGKKMVAVVIHRDYCRIRGRYMIVASFKAPDQHLGCYELLSLGGTTVYVFAKQVKFNQKADVKYSTGAERVYYIGCDEDKLDEMLEITTNQVYQKIKGVYSEKYEATTEFIPLEPWVIDKDRSGDEEGGDEGEGTGSSSSTDTSNFDLW